MKPVALICFELLLLFSSILVFRSLWVFMDRSVFLSQPAGLGLLFLVGLSGFIFALVKLNKK